MIIYYDDSKKEWSNKRGCLKLVIRKDLRGDLNQELNDRKEPDLKNIPGKEKASAKALKTDYSKVRNSRCRKSIENKRKGCTNRQRSDRVTFVGQSSSDFISHIVGIFSLCFNFCSHFSTSVLVTSLQNYSSIIIS